MEVEEGFEPASEEMEGVGGRAGQSVFFSFALSFVLSFFLPFVFILWRNGGRRARSPTMTAGFRGCVDGCWAGTGTGSGPPLLP